ncbi:hypothetical protein KC19_VG082600 [Ceratodon purpureus]|uniref:Uncharacterized protein n=1 Tax=Ceratodon purpureus TaxID=3225 RepID=A0A8T0HNB2_CERPU|nr:hypothetical protein KC19_VG082600 [Ceratodon purpureus]
MNHITMFMWLMQTRSLTSWRILLSTLIRNFNRPCRSNNKDQSFSSFLALPELIPAAKRRRQQPLVDFTKSRILTSEESVSVCEQLLKKRQENEEATKRRAAERKQIKKQER